ncbi:hypothetical protein BGZ65_007367 [Modicella reniformis]|uniref:Uncharacterized protein n=1 Tax=Modicella reniformis TaxID=1440133 RepID=A0A9P6LXM3_9FUNG|nr:hypothetical protein BGZ65_007367 [Modicella reniformis]
MLSSSVQDLFGMAMGGGINIDILGFWTDMAKDPFNRMVSPAMGSTADLTIPSSSATVESTATSSSSTATATALSTVSMIPTYSSLTAASAVLRSHAVDFNQLWSALTLFNTMVDDYEARFEVRYVSATLLGLQANSRQLKWPN